MAMTAAQLLDELMGKDRNLVPGEKSAQVHWSHPDCCKHFICGFCPHDLFVNTKADLGPCGKVHDDLLRIDYEKSSRYGKMAYEDEFISFLQSIQSDVERKIRRGHERLQMNKAREQELAQNDSDKTKMLTDHINQLLEEIEQLGTEGKVEEAQGVAKLVEQLKDEREQSKVNAGAAGQEKQMEVCEVCGAFLIVGDAQSRVDDHLQGKQHVGYAKIKSTIEDLRSRPWLKRPTEKTSEREGKEDVKRTDRDRDNEREKRKRSRSRSREKRRDSHRSKDRSRERSHRSHHSGRDRDRDRERRRSRDRDSRRRSRSRSRDRSHRRSRSKDRENKRSSRNSSRDRRERRSRERTEETENRHSRESSRSKDKDRRDNEKNRNEKHTNGNTNDESGEEDQRPPSIEPLDAVMEQQNSDKEETSD